MTADFLPDYNCVQWNGRYRPIFRLFTHQKWRQVRVNKTPVECDTPLQAIKAAKAHVQRILNPTIRTEAAQADQDVLGVEAWRLEQARKVEDDQRATFNSIFIKGKAIVVEKRRPRP